MIKNIEPKNIAKIIIIILAVLLILATRYIVMDKINIARQEQEDIIFQNGMQEGTKQSIIYLMSLAITCQQIPITVQNQTINLIAVEYLGSG